MEGAGPGFAEGERFALRPGVMLPDWSLVTDPLAHLSTWGAELVGLALLAWFWIAFELGDPERRRRFLADGQLRA